MGEFFFDIYGRPAYFPDDPRIGDFGTPRKETLLRLASETPEGCFVEFGVHAGGSAWRLANLAILQGRECHLFDTWKGIPEASEFDVIPVGALADVDVEKVKEAIPSAIFHVGVFPDTMPEQFAPVAFVHVDCDQYRSCLAAIDHFKPYMVTGGVMLFDDFNVTPGVRKAVNERFNGLFQITREGKAFIYT